jgi:hypothetical protein
LAILQSIFVALVFCSLRLYGLPAFSLAGLPAWRAPISACLDESLPREIPKAYFTRAEALFKWGSLVSSFVAFLPFAMTVF